MTEARKKAIEKDKRKKSGLSWNLFLLKLVMKK